ncbi:hypothetical protein AVEN_212983-1 [Araneus ventricosus]|uniref:Uncharacterized protein n=1 Tax=Araneus ventricosus TaxID=182803 RepID=A0A4Y2RXZ7_ARAVE|nr:hypothetical protein AVEN_212983-1 [Araneus ventricosus]
MTLLASEKPHVWPAAVWIRPRENGEEPPRVTVDLRGNFYTARDRLARCERVNMLGEASRIQYKMHSFFAIAFQYCNCLIFLRQLLIWEVRCLEVLRSLIRETGKFPESRILTIRVCAALGFSFQVTEGRSIA